MLLAAKLETPLTSLLHLVVLKDDHSTKCAIKEKGTRPRLKRLLVRYKRKFLSRSSECLSVTRQGKRKNLICEYREIFTTQNLLWFRSTFFQRTHVVTEFDLSEWYFDLKTVPAEVKKHSQCNSSMYYRIGIQLKFIGFSWRTKTTDSRKP